MKTIKFLIYLILLNVCLLTLSCRTSKDTSSQKTSKSKKTLSEKEQQECLAIFLEANKEKMIGNYAKAGALFAECIRKNPKDDASFYELASVLTLDKKYEDALLLAKEAVSLNPGNEWYQVLLAELYNNTKQPAGSIKIYENLIKKHPQKIDYYYELAVQYLYARMYNDAIKVYNQLEKIIGINEELSVQKQSIYIYNKNYDKAALEIKKLIDAFPNESRYRIMLADFYMDGGKKTEAFEIYDFVQKTDPTNAEVNLSLADYYRSIGKTDLFYIQLKRAFSNSNVDIESKVKILLSYFTLTDKEENQDFLTQAYELLDLLIASHSNSAISYSIYADFLSRDNKKEEARNMFLKVIELDNSRYLVWEQLLVLESDLRNYSSMDSLSTAALELFPEQALLYLFKGFSNYMLKNYEQAIDAFNKGLEYELFNEKLIAEFNMYLGDAYNHLKKYVESDAAYDNALKIDPKNILVLNNYSYYLSLRGEKLDRALTMAKKANELKPNVSSYQDTYAWVLFKMESFTDALIWIEKAVLNGGSNNPVIIEHYGDILFKLDRKAEALEKWKKAKEMGKVSEELDKKIEIGRLD